MVIKKADRYIFNNAACWVQIVYENIISMF